MSANRTAKTLGDFADIDLHFARFIAGFGGEEARSPQSASSQNPRGEAALQTQKSLAIPTNRAPSQFAGMAADLPSLAAALLSRNIRNGHICLDLSEAPADLPLDGAWPSPEQWQEAFGANRAFGGPEAGLPLVLDAGNRLYLRRYWEYEQRLAEALVFRCQPESETSAMNAGAALEGDRQQAAVQVALAKKLVIVSGGPGTGKTTTVLKILQGISKAAQGSKPVRVALSAPTGKAAARLQETLSGQLGEEHSGVALQTACTLHRLLGTRRDSVQFRHNASNPLPYDLVVVDEASMVPLTLMAKLFDAIPHRARVILLGDRDQLASVEPGSVLGDIAEAAGQPSCPLHGHLVELKKNYRFGNESGIYALCNAVREGDVEQSLAILEDSSRNDLASGPAPSAGELPAKLREPILAGYSAYLKTSSPEKGLKEFAKFRVLAGLRVGPFGVENLNRQIEAILRKEGLVSGAGGSEAGAVYPGKPVMVTANDYSLHLFNGDIGILFPDPATGALLAWFVSEEQGMRAVSPARLPQHEPAFAMTVHKSQGSEFDHVLLVLPDKPSPVLTRELLYTGLTRARKRVEVWFNEPVLRQTIGHRIQRESGLRDRLVAL